MIDTVNDIEESYINYIGNVYPALSTLWGHENGEYTDISEEAAARNLKQLKELLSQCDRIENVDYLKKNMEMRLFEDTVLWKKMLTANSFYELTLGTLLVLWDDFVSYMYGVNPNIVEQRLINVIPAIEHAIKEMEKREFSYLDLAYTEFAIKKALDTLAQREKEYQDMEKLFSEAIKKGREFQTFISKRKKQVVDVNKIYFYGPEVISQYIERKSGGRIQQGDINRYYEEAVSNLKVDNGEHELKKIQCSAELIEQVINELYDEMKEYFGEMSDLMDTLKIVDVGDSGYVNGGFSYANSPEEGKMMGYLFFSSKYQFSSIEELKIKIIHEIYPGHHYMKMEKLRDSQSHNMFRLWQDDIWLEGWAKYCEWFYANKTQSLIFDKSLYFMSLMFVLVLDIQYYGKTLKEVVQHMKEIGNIETKTAKMLVINAYRDWETHVNYYIGFRYLRELGSPSLNDVISL